MKSKAPLLLMEQMIMLLVFALAAALCLQSFTYSDRLSRRGEARDTAATLSQTAAETVRHQGGTPEEALSAAAAALGGTFDGEALKAGYDREGNPGGEEFLLTVRPVSTDVPGLAKVSVQVEWGREILFEIDTAWQEVTVTG